MTWLFIRWQQLYNIRIKKDVMVLNWSLFVLNVLLQILNLFLLFRVHFRNHFRNRLLRCINFNKNSRVIWWKLFYTLSSSLVVSACCLICLYLLFHFLSVIHIKFFSINITNLLIGLDVFCCKNDDFWVIQISRFNQNWPRKCITMLWITCVDQRDKIRSIHTAQSKLTKIKHSIFFPH